MSFDGYLGSAAVVFPLCASLDRFLTGAWASQCLNAHRERRPELIVNAGLVKSTDWTGIAGFWVGIVGLTVSIIGFAIAIWQLKRTAKASEATRDAIVRTEQKMATNHLMVILPQFHLLENDLDYAAQHDDRSLARRALVSYSHFATEAATILSGQNHGDAGLIRSLQTSARDALLTKARLINTAMNTSTKSITKDIRDIVSDVSIQLSAIIVNYELSSSSEQG